MVLTCFLGESEAQPLAGDKTSLESVVISGTRTGSLLDESGSTITVLTGTELEQRQIRFVSDALRDVPGVAVSRQGPVGNFTQVRIRGAEANHTVVVVDGVKINDPFTSEVDFAHLLSAQIDRIEILRGPQSVLYGSEAIGGVISIFTKRADPGTQFEASAEGGSFSTYDGTAAVRGATGAWDYALSATGFWTDGTNASRFGTEDDGYRNQIYYARAGWAPSATASVDASVRYRNNRTLFDPQDFSFVGFDPSPTFGLVIDGDRHTEGDQLDTLVRGRLVTGAINHQLAFTRTKTEEDTFTDGVFAGGYQGRRDRFDYQGIWRFGAPRLPQTLTFAAEYEKQHFESFGPTPASPQNQTQDNDKSGYGLEYQVRFASRTALTLSARRDNNQLFEDSSTYRVTVAQPLGQQLKLHSSYGTGVANPTFFELFGFIPGSFDPNPNLKPEKSRGFDIGADLTFANKGRLSVTYFNTDLQDEIATTFDSTTFRSSVANLDGKSKRQGVEVEAEYAPSADLTVWVTYTYMDSKQSDGELEVRRPRNMASAAVTYAPPSSPGAITLAVDYNGRQQDFDFTGLGTARVNLRDYTLVRLAGTYALTKNWNLFARVENLLDQDYEEIFSYQPSGRAFFAGFQAKF